MHYLKAKGDGTGPIPRCLRFQNGMLLPKKSVNKDHYKDHDL